MRNCKIDKIKEQKKVVANNSTKKQKRKKKNALILCRDGNEFWTTQEQFWQWVRQKIVVKLGDGPLHGKYVREADQFEVVLGNAVLNLTHPNHLSEVLYSRRYKASKG
jgi:hypothetical protein